MKKTLLTLIMLVIMNVVGAAQTTTTRVLEYQYDNVTPAIVATWTQVIKVNGVVLTTLPTCIASGVDTICTVPMPTLNAATNNVISVTASDIDESMESVLNYNPSSTTNNLKLPTGLTIKVTVTVIVGQ